MPNFTRQERRQVAVMLTNRACSLSLFKMLFAFISVHHTSPEGE